MLAKAPCSTNLVDSSHKLFDGIDSMLGAATIRGWLLLLSAYTVWMWLLFESCGCHFYLNKYSDPEFADSGAVYWAGFRVHVVQCKLSAQQTLDSSACML